MNELALAVKHFLSKLHGDCREGPNCKHGAWPRSPLHISAEAGQVSLCEHILKITKDKNPKMQHLGNDDWLNCYKGWTSLHEAARGHLLICSLIMDEIQDKNPGDDTGVTPLHAAAAGGKLETFKMIMNKADTDINPSENGGWTPLHARLLSKAIC